MLARSTKVEAGADALVCDVGFRGSAIRAGRVEHAEKIGYANIGALFKIEQFAKKISRWRCAAIAGAARPARIVR
jgi:hypothetical protein